MGRRDAVRTAAGMTTTHPRSDASTRFTLPSQPADVPWPTLTWPTGPQLSGSPIRLARLVDEAFDPRLWPGGHHRAILVIQGGRIVAERYGTGLDATSRHLSWSVAKSVTHAMVGIAVDQGRLDVTEPMCTREWESVGDGRGAITVADLLAMRSGLRFNEDYLDDTTSDCLEMLFGSGASDVAAYAASLESDHPVGATFNYSSGSTNIVVRRLVDSLGAGDSPAERRAVTEKFAREQLFDPIGAGETEMRFDEAGTFVGSSYLYATARDLARFGLLYLRDGVWEDERVLPAGWVDDARTIRSSEAESGWFYGSHWWVRGDDLGTFWANGYDGQMISCIPALDALVVRFGELPVQLRPATEQWFFDVVGSLRPAAS